MTDGAIIAPKTTVEVSGVGLTYHAGTSRTVLHSVDLHVEAGSCTALVGESGSGKTSLGRTIAGLLPPTATVSGHMKIQGRITYMLQDAVSALNPLRRVSWQLRQALRTRNPKRSDFHSVSLELLAAVGVPEPELVMHRYPHELSGGLAQRVLLATVLATDPQILVVDEPTSALDVTTQAKIMKLFRDIIEERGITIVLITHDIGAAAMIADRVAVMYEGEIVEEAPTDELIDHPKHEYTRALVDAALTDNESTGETSNVEGEHCGAH